MLRAGNQSSGGSSESNGSGIARQPFALADEQRIQARLNQQLGPEFISARVGAGGAKVFYITAQVVIDMANSIFGFNGWSSEIVRIEVDYMDADATGTKYNVGVSAVVRITLKDGTTRDDVGFGSADNMRQKGLAFDKARKQAVTDAYKRALKNFGNVLGLCLYDHDYLRNVSRVKTQQKPWDEKNLHRVNNDNTRVALPVKQEPSPPNLKRKHEEVEQKICAEDNYEDFDDGDFDESMLDEAAMPVIQAPPVSRPPVVTKPPVTNYAAPMQSNGINNAQRPNPARPNMQNAPPQMRPPNPAPQRMNSPERTNGGNQTVSIPEDAPAAFYSARAITVQGDSPALKQVQNRQFNPHAESPSIRKTGLVDLKVSGPVPKMQVGQAAAAAVAATAVTSSPKNVVNPQLDASRKIGMPARPPGTTAYKPQIPANIARPPLQDGNAGNLVRDPFGDANKRLKSE